jgi:hypothetical protein
MDLNPYEAPEQLVPALPRKVTIGAKIFRIGALLFGLGVLSMAALISLAYFYLMDRTPTPPDWYGYSFVVSAALVPVGIVIATAGGAIWLWGRLRRPPNP